jgi:hypothetical protein
MRRRAGQSLLTLLAAACAVSIATLRSAEVVFRSDDPLAREPETQDAAQVKEWEIDLFIDLASNLFGQPGDNDTGRHAGNVNTIDEVPDSSWFTNRIVARQVSIDEAVRASNAGGGVAPGPWTVVAPKQSGFAPGFTIRDSAGETWFVSFDARGYPEAATGAILVATKIFWTLGYFQADSVLASIRPDQVQLADTAQIKVPSGRRRAMRSDDLSEIWERSHRSPDGSYRAVASRRLPGRALGGFRYHGTRPDDPNDIVPHEHRRELRALQVFGAWTNLVDMKAGNTLDMLITDHGRSVVRHYLQDVGSTFGTGANAPREYFEGWENLYEGDLVWRRLISLGFFIRPWQLVPYHESAAIGRFEGDLFDPAQWKPRVPTASLRHAQPDDLFWAARRVMAFSDEMIRAIVATGAFSRAADAKHLADTLIERRDKIGTAYLTALNPIVSVALSADGKLSYEIATAPSSVSPQYEISWSYFDNATGGETAIATSRSGDGSAASPETLRRDPGTIVRTRLRATNPPRDDWQPVDAYFRRDADRWKLVGLDRGPGALSRQ